MSTRRTRDTSTPGASPSEPTHRLRARLPTVPRRSPLGPEPCRRLRFGRPADPVAVPWTLPYGVDGQVVTDFLPATDGGYDMDSGYDIRMDLRGSRQRRRPTSRRAGRRSDRRWWRHGRPRRDGRRSSRLSARRPPRSQLRHQRGRHHAGVFGPGRGRRAGLTGSRRAGLTGSRRAAPCSHGCRPADLRYLRCPAISAAWLGRGTAVRGCGTSRSHRRHTLVTVSAYRSHRRPRGRCHRHPT